MDLDQQELRRSLSLLFVAVDLDEQKHSSTWDHNQVEAEEERSS